MTRAARWLGLPVAAVVAVVCVAGVQVSNGGGSYQPLAAADPCAERVVTSQATGLDALTERLVLIGIDDAACALGVTREALTLRIAQSSSDQAERVSDAEAAALKTGLLAAVQQQKADGTLPLASELVDEALDTADLNGLLERALRLVPDSVIDAALKTDDVLTRAIDGLDVREVLADIDDRSDLNAQVQVAVTQAVKDSLLARLRGLL